MQPGERLQSIKLAVLRHAAVGMQQHPQRQQGQHHGQRDGGPAEFHRFLLQLAAPLL